eukprot:CAMPEP_0174841982 /NCGR_PEP_ID=MMETSP1114-20130205/9642_1 /TAXON_ID=312471 /ORGANISM="Neobodo designis, Strain CCAP 1951/1" /LENGTH=264 /DNA_ID=CAMNT_0016076179 /DNA_START=49 /DNA_END=840 /DNA_ORIENTATION=-
MADSDDDLPPPPAKAPPKQVVLTDSDDDLPPPPAKTTPAAAPAPGAKPPVVLPDSSDDDLPPPPATAGGKKVVLPDSSDDDLPPPPAKAGAPVPAKPSEDADDDLPPPPAKPAGQSLAAEDAAPQRTRSRHVNPEVAQQRKERRQTTVRRNVNDIAFEGFLMKQSPTWPYTSQKRWCVLKGRVLTYYETQQSHTPAGTLDLKGAKIADVSKTANKPNSFGLTGPTGQLKSRVYIFNALSREEYQQWINVLEQVLVEPKVSELHW